MKDDMHSGKRDGWNWPPADQWFTIWGMLMMVVPLALISQLFPVFSRLGGAPWMWAYFAGLVIGGLGISLIFYAKVPLYRQRRFFTFGSRALPEKRRPFYRWGYGCVVLAVILLLCLLLPK